jgi:putative phosphoesterase
MSPARSQPDSKQRLGGLHPGRAASLVVGPSPGLALAPEHPANRTAQRLDRHVATPRDAWQLRTGGHAGLWHVWRIVSSVAVLSDIHGVLPALERVLAEPAVADAELIVVTGDHTWGPQPVQVLDRLLSLGDRVALVRGNADRELLQMSLGVDVGLADDPISVWGASQLGVEHQQLLDVMPEQLTIEIDGFGPVRFCHATPRDDEEVVLVDSRIDRWGDVLAGLPAEVATVVCGHTHMPFLRLVDGRLVLNPGSVGLPYGRAGAHWAILSGGVVSMGRTLIDTGTLAHEVIAGSELPEVAQWVDQNLRRSAGDREAIATFGLRDGR